MKILITAGTTGQAHKLKRLLYKEDNFIFGDQDEMPAFVSSSFRFIRIPPGDSFSFAHELLKTCLDEEISCIYPLRKAEIISLAEAVQLFEEYGIKIIIPPKNKLESLMHRTPGRGFLKVVINGSIYAAEGGENTALPSGLQNGVFIMDPGMGTDYHIFTVD